MALESVTETARTEWTPLLNTSNQFSTGMAALDRLLGGGYRRGSLALFQVDETVETADIELLFTPTLLNFLYQSNGIIAVLPARMSPHEFRAHLIRWVSRRRFDSRVRVVSYVGEDAEAPYVVELNVSNGGRSASTSARSKMTKDMAKMVAAEKAARGARGRMFLELIAFEIAETVAGAETASRMFFHGIKRVRGVGNLCIGILRPGLGCSAAVRGMADIELVLHRDDRGLLLRGNRPAFPDQLVAIDPERGAPFVTLAAAPVQHR